MKKNIALFILLLFSISVYCQNHFDNTNTGLSLDSLSSIAEVAITDSTTVQQIHTIHPSGVWTWTPEENYIQPVVEMKDIQLSKFKIIVAEKGANVHVTQSDSSMISIGYFKEMKNQEKLYAISGDTLHVYGGLRTFVRCNNLTTVVGNSPSFLGIDKFVPKKLKVKMNGGKFVFDNRGMTTPEFDIDIMSISGADITIYYTNARNINIASDNSKINLWSKVSVITGKIKNHSLIENIFNGEKITLERDNTSTFR